MKSVMQTANELKTEILKLMENNTVMAIPGAGTD